jgi:hypothetical protein
MKWLGIMFMAALLAIAPGYGSAQQPKDTSPATQPQGPEVKGEPAGTAKSFTPAERQAYEKKTAANLEEIEKNIDASVLKVNKVVPQKKRMVTKIVKGLAVQAMNARNQLEALQKAPENSWGGLKINMDRNMESLNETWETAKPLFE